MLERSREKLRRHGADVPLVEADAAHLPFRDGAFDAVFHHGGFAEFGDKPAAAAEMLRVARYGARIVLCDVGVPADRNVGLVNRLLLKTQPEYNQPPPVNLFPPGLRDFHLGWIGGGAWYLIDFVNARD
jgi:ubiquinone/menaquinone biosynthesis C-methylase UbiE